MTWGIYNADFYPPFTESIRIGWLEAAYSLSQRDSLLVMTLSWGSFPISFSIGKAFCVTKDSSHWFVF